jgi:hypothetical protein
MYSYGYHLDDCLVALVERIGIKIWRTGLTNDPEQIDILLDTYRIGEPKVIYRIVQGETAREARIDLIELYR